MYQVNQVDAGLDFEVIRNILYCPICSNHLNNNNARNLFKNEPCSLCSKYGIERGDTLYVRDYGYKGIYFKEIDNIQFCPLCGKELKEDNSLDFYK